MSDRLSIPIAYPWRLARPDGTLLKFRDEGEVWDTPGFQNWTRESVCAGIVWHSWDVANKAGITFVNTGLRPVPWPITGD